MSQSVDLKSGNSDRDSTSPWRRGLTQALGKRQLWTSRQKLSFAKNPLQNCSKLFHCLPAVSVAVDLALLACSGLSCLMWTVFFLSTLITGSAGAGTHMSSVASTTSMVSPGYSPSINTGSSTLLLEATAASGGRSLIM